MKLSAVDLSLILDEAASLWYSILMRTYYADIMDIADASAVMVEYP